MKLRGVVGLSLLGALLSGGASLISAACSSDDTAAAPPPKGSAPAKPNAAKTTSTAEHNYALHKIYLGDTDRNGVTSRDAWRTFGFNLDGKTTIAAKDTEVCRNKEGTVLDGENGIDNAFGSNILQLIVTLKSDIGPTINDALDKGKAGGMIDVIGIDDNAIPQTSTGLSAQVFAAGGFSDAGAPTWTTADNWPIRRELLVGGTLQGGSQVRFDDAWINQGQFASGQTSKIFLSLNAFGATVDLAIYRGVIVFDHPKAGKAVNGTIAGVLKTDELLDTLRKLAGRVNSSFCPGSDLLENVLKNIATASDILVDGTNDPNKDCDGISIGLGFEADEIAPPKQLADPAGPAGADPCLDAGPG